MDAVTEPKPKRRGVAALIEDAMSGNGAAAPTTLHNWWDWRWVHPLTDDEFVAAFATWVFAKSEDRSVRQVRNRLIYFVTHFMAPEVARSLTLYREEHPL